MLVPNEAELRGQRVSDHARGALRLVGYAVPGHNAEMDRFLEGAAATGWWMLRRRPDVFNPETCDVLDCTLVATVGGRAHELLIGDAYRAAGHTVAVLDLPPLRFLPGEWVGFFRDYPGHAWQGPVDGSRFDAFPWPARITPARSGPVVLLGQVPQDASLRMPEHDYWVWLADTVHTLNAAGVDWVFRPHPKARDVANDPILAGAQLAPEGSIAEMLEWSAGVVCWSSTCQFEALYHGVPVSVGQRGDAVWPIPEQDETERRARLEQICWNQFTLEELSSGYTAQILRDGAPAPLQLELLAPDTSWIARAGELLSAHAKTLPITTPTRSRSRSRKAS